LLSPSPKVPVMVTDADVTEVDSSKFLAPLVLEIVKRAIPVSVLVKLRQYPFNIIELSSFLPSQIMYTNCL